MRACIENYFLKNQLLKQGCWIFLLALGATVTVSAAQWESLEKTEGAGLFKEKCGMCHRESGMGTGILARRMSAELALLENREDLQGQFIETAVRTGFGIMFPMSRGEVSDGQLQLISEYLQLEQDAGGEP